jgi:hypothetical protein
MRTAAVDLELCRQRQLSTDADGSAAVKAARLYEAMVADGASAIRWFLAESRAMRHVHELVPEPDERRALQKRATDMVQLEFRGICVGSARRSCCDLRTSVSLLSMDIPACGTSSSSV